MEKELNFEQKALAVANRFFELKKESEKRFAEIKVLLELSGITCVEHGSIDEAATYMHKDFPDIEFYDEDEGNTTAFTKDGKYVDVKKHKDSEKLKKICDFLNLYGEFCQQAFSIRIVKNTDYKVGKYIKEKQDISFTELGETSFWVQLKYAYVLDIYYWAEKLEDISVYYYKTDMKPEEKFWEKANKSKS